MVLIQVVGPEGNKGDKGHSAMSSGLNGGGQSGDTTMTVERYVRLIIITTWQTFSDDWRLQSLKVSKKLFLTALSLISISVLN
jgi:hypothetical protein